MAREIARFERAGFDARAAVAHGLRVRHERLEDGMMHAHAAADWLRLAAGAGSAEKRLAALLEPLGHIAWDTAGAGEFPYAEEVAEWSGPGFVAAIEAEDEPAAIARMRGALAEGIPYARLRAAIGEAALAHYADIGHCAIYALKTGQLIERLGQEIAEPALLALSRMLARATREERLPAFRGYAKALAEWDGTGSAVARAGFDRACGRRHLAPNPSPRRGVRCASFYDALVGTAAFNLLRFDAAFERATANAIADNVGWLDFTLALTFANACRQLCEERPDLWPKAALQLALFVGRNRKYLDASADAARWRVADRAAFFAEETAALYDHGIPEPIVACHRLKLLFALIDECEVAPDAPWGDEVCAAANRFRHTPMKRHHGLRIAAQALDFVAREG
jgi:hypothetical protein